MLAACPAAREAGFAQHVDLWFACPHAITDAGLLARYERLLSGEERARRQGLVFDRDRRDFLVARALLRTVLAGYTGGTPSDLRLVTGRHGRPELACPGGEPQPPRFSLAHTEGLMALAVTRGRAVGLDVESRGNAHHLDGQAGQFLAVRERATLAGLPSGERLDRPVELWTLKEAYSKAQGLGMGLPFRSVAFEFQGAVGLQAGFEADARFALMRHPSGHVLGVFAARDWDPSSAWTATEVVPLVSAQPCRLALLRHST